MANSGTEMYEKALKEEIERFKQEINYEGIIEEIEQDMKKLGSKRLELCLE